MKKIEFLGLGFKETIRIFVLFIITTMTNEFLMIYISSRLIGLAWAATCLWILIDAMFVASDLQHAECVIKELKVLNQDLRLRKIGMAQINSTVLANNEMLTSVQQHVKILSYNLSKKLSIRAGRTDCKHSNSWSHDLFDSSINVSLTPPSLCNIKTNKIKL
jgi:hypothetical protein